MFSKIGFPSIINFLLWEYASNLLQACTVLFTYLEKKIKTELVNQTESSSVPRLVSSVEIK